MSFLVGDFGSSMVVPSGRVTTMASLGSSGTMLMTLPEFASFDLSDTPADLPPVSDDPAAFPFVQSPLP
jgi:hypothetical protein